MEISLDEIKVYLKIDSYEEDDLLTDLKDVSECYLEDAGIKKNYNKATYKICVLMLISHYYANRNVVVEGTKYVEEIPYGVTNIMQQLKYGV